MAAVYVVARIVANPSRTGDLKALLIDLAVESRREEGCVRYEVLEEEGSAGSFLLVEEWQSAGDLDAHNTTSHVRDALGRAPALVAQLPEIRRCRKIG